MKQFILFWGIKDATSFSAIDESMQQQKENVDQTKNIYDCKKKDEEKKKSHDHGGRNHKNSKYKLDPNAKRGSRARCGKHPNSNHSWGQCCLNPKNPNNKLKQ